MAGTLDTGRDTYCVDALQPGRTARGVQLVAQRCYHRLITPAGDLWGGADEADFGLDLASLIGSTEERNAASTLPVRIQNELLKDPTVDTVKVVATRNEDAKSVSWTFAIRVVSAVGPFELLVTADAVSVELLGVT